MIEGWLWWLFRLLDVAMLSKFCSVPLAWSVENPLLKEEVIVLPLDTTFDKEFVQGVGNRGSLWVAVYDRLFWHSAVLGDNNGTGSDVDVLLLLLEDWWDCCWVCCCWWWWCWRCCCWLYLINAVVVISVTPSRSLIGLEYFCWFSSSW